jgi:phosphopantetheinyl transferase
MPLLSKYTNPSRAIWRIDESSGELLAQLGDKAGYEPILETFGTETRRAEWLASRLLLKELSGEETAVAYHPGGAPYLPGRPFHISISHTKGYAAVLLQPHPPAGIDIERRGDRIRKVRDRFLSPEERDAIDPSHEADHLLIYWCAKEVLFKMTRETGVDMRTHLHVRPFPFSRSGTITACESRTPHAASYPLAYSVDTDFVWVWSLG